MEEFPDVHIGVVGGDKTEELENGTKNYLLAQNKFKDKESQLHFIPLLQSFQKS